MASAHYLRLELMVTMTVKTSKKDNKMKEIIQALLLIINHMEDDYSEKFPLRRVNPFSVEKEKLEKMLELLK